MFGCLGCLFYDPDRGCINSYPDLCRCPQVNSFPDPFCFDYGIIELKRRFSFKLPLDSYLPISVSNVISVSSNFVYVNAGCTDLVHFVYIIRRISSRETRCDKYDLKDFTIRIVHKGDMSFSI